jgi:ribosomal protein S18 acetylase RimI-like enzyme
MELDHASFPWLWWNSREEMEGYMQLPQVYVYAGWHDGQPVGYASFTMYERWAHLDRLVVAEQWQGRRFGAAQLHHTLLAMAAQGAAHVSLSTQEHNTQSHRLYKGFGFRQMPDMMNLYGLWLKRDEGRQTTDDG